MFRPSRRSMVVKARCRGSRSCGAAMDHTNACAGPGAARSSRNGSRRWGSSGLHQWSLRASDDRPGCRGRPVCGQPLDACRLVVRPSSTAGPARSGGHPLRRLRRLLLQAELGWPADRLAGAMLAAAVVVGLLAYQLLGWLVPSLFAAAFCIIGPIVYIAFRRARKRAERQEALLVVLERIREELENVTL